MRRSTSVIREVPLNGCYSPQENRNTVTANQRHYTDRLVLSYQPGPWAYAGMK